MTTMLERPKMAPDDPRHGTINGYINLGCRCDACKKAHSEYQRELRVHRKANGRVPEHLHGTATGDRCYYCKCGPCREAGRAQYRRYYQPSPRRARVRAEAEAMYADHKAGLSIAEVAAKWGVSPNVVHGRFKRAGLPVIRRAAREATAMYFDYCTGMSVEEVAAKWGVTHQLVSSRFSRMGFARRPKSGGRVQPKASKGISFSESNAMRARESGERRAAQARAALEVAQTEIHRRVLELRAAHPDKSLAELALLCNPPLSKDSYAAHLRRALARAE